MKTADRAKYLTWALMSYAVLSLGSMATMGVGAALVGLALLLPAGKTSGLIEDLSRARSHPAYEKYAVVSIALLIALAISLIAATLWPLTYGGQRPHVSFLKDISKAWYLLWPLFLAPALVSIGAQGRKKVLLAWLVAFGALSALSIPQYFTGFPRPQEIPGTGRYHATLFAGHHLSIASLFLFPFFAALDLSVRGDVRARTGLSRRAVAVIAALGAICLFLTYSRMVWVALPIGLFVWACWALPKEKRGTVLFVAILGLILIFLLPPVSNRILEMRGILTRQELWNANLEFFKARWLTGAGWHHNQELSGYYLMEKHQISTVFSGHAHNNLLDVLGGTGLLGTAAWIAWCVLSFKMLLPLARRGEGFARGLFCAWIVFQLNGLTQVNFWEAKVLHQISWAMAWALCWALLGPKKEKAWQES